MKKIDEEIRQTTFSLPVRLKARMNLKFTNGNLAKKEM